MVAQCRLTNIAGLEFPCPSKPKQDMFFSQDGRSYLDVSDYGVASVLPSDEALSILSAMDSEEKLNLHSLLSELQLRLEKISKTPGMLLHPSARASLWGRALARIGDHYYALWNHDRTLFFMASAWSLSHYPVFAVQLALLLLKRGNIEAAKGLFQTYLLEYPNSRKGSMLLVNAYITDSDLQHLAATVRENLAAIETSGRMKSTK
jgi:hypothetical protein